jgi:hypothetical protein
MITKEKIYQQMEALPDSFEMEDLIEKLLFIDKLENRIRMSENDDTISDEEMSQEIEAWLK